MIITDFYCIIFNQYCICMCIFVIENQHIAIGTSTQLITNRNYLNRFKRKCINMFYKRFKLDKNSQILSIILQIQFFALFCFADLVNHSGDTAFQAISESILTKEVLRTPITRCCTRSKNIEKKS